MIRNVIFFLLALGALFWIGYAGLNLVNFSENSNPEKLFGSEDGRVFVLNRPQEIQIEATNFSLQPRLYELYGILSSTMRKNERIFVSEKKAHILLQTSNLLSEDEIMSRFNAHGMESVGAKIYRWKNFKISFFKGVVDCQIEAEKNAFNSLKWTNFDKKSSCSIIEFSSQEAIIKDFYQSKGKLTIFTRQPIFSSVHQSIDDQSLYGNYIPSTVRSYHFIEKSLLAKQDPIFKQSAAFSWTNSGMVAFEYNNANFLLFDLKNGYEPEQLLINYIDTNQSLYRHFKGAQLTEKFPNNAKRGFYLKIIDNYALICDIESALSEAEVALGLDQTLSRYRQKKNLIFSDVPQIVNERKWSNEEKMAKSSYQGYAIGMEIINASKIKQSNNTDGEIKSYVLSADVVDFIADETKDLVFAYDKNNNLSAFAQGKNLFQSNISEGFKGTIFWSAKLKNTVVFTSSSKLYVCNENNIAVSGFPVEIPKGVSKGAVSFLWKGKENFLVTSTDGNYHWINEKGVILETKKTGFSSLQTLPNVWVSANRLFFGFRDERNFNMFEAEKGVLLRSFPLSKTAVAIALENELTFYDIEKNALFMTNQKGEKKMVTDVQVPIWIRPISERNNDGFVVKSSNVISYYSEDGKLKTKVKIPFESVEYLDFSNSLKKGFLLGAIDGLGNKLYLYQLNGSKITLPKNQAQKKYQLSNQKDALVVYTLLDKFIIQYVL